MQTINQIINDMGAPPSEFTYTPTAEWVKWRSFYARAIQFFQGIMDSFREEVELSLRTKQPGSRAWYHDKAMEFQDGDTLLVNPTTGLLGYNTVNLEKRILARCSVVEGPVGGATGVIFKVAKYNNLDDRELVPLDENTELLNFQTYIENVKFTGTDVEVVNAPGDLVKLIGNVFYDPAYPVQVVIAQVLEKLLEYRDNIDFNGVVKHQEFVHAIKSAEGVYSVDIDNLSWRAFNDEYQQVEGHAPLFAGYFNYEITGGNFSLVFRNYKNEAMYTTVTNFD